jgi:hypothetical protein
MVTGMATTVPAPIRSKAAQKPRISPRIRQAVDLLAKGTARTQRDAASKVGLSEEHLCRMLKKPQVRAFLAERTRQTLSLGSVRAGQRLVELLDGSSEKVALEASRHVLALDGFTPPSSPQIVNTFNLLSGYDVVLPGWSAPDGPTIEGHVAKTASADADDG